MPEWRSRVASAEIEIPDDLAPAKYRLGLWLPDAAASIRKDPRYAIRVANRDAPWWQSGAGEYGVNLLGSVTVK